MPDVESPGPAHHIKVFFAHSVPKPSAWHTRVHHSTHPLSLQSLGSSLTSTLEPSPRLNVKVKPSPTDLCRLKLETADRRRSRAKDPNSSLLLPQIIRESQANSGQPSVLAHRAMALEPNKGPEALGATYTTPERLGNPG